MNNKAFTLIELIAVVVIIGVLSMVGVVAISNTIANSRKKAYKNFEENLKVAARDYIAIHTDQVSPEHPIVTLYADELHDAGFLDNLIDPAANQECDYENSRVWVEADYTDTTSPNVKYTYKVCLKCPNYQSDEEICSQGQAESPYQLQ